MHAFYAGNIPKVLAQLKQNRMIKRVKFASIGHNEKQNPTSGHDLVSKIHKDIFTTPLTNTLTNDI